MADGRVPSLPADAGNDGRQGAVPTGGGTAGKLPALQGAVVNGPVAHRCAPLQGVSPVCHSERSEESVPPLVGAVIGRPAFGTNAICRRQIQSGFDVVSPPQGVRERRTAGCRPYRRTRGMVDGRVPSLPAGGTAGKLPALQGAVVNGPVAHRCAPLQGVSPVCHSERSEESVPPVPRRGGHWPPGIRYECNLPQANPAGFRRC